MRAIRPPGSLTHLFLFRQGMTSRLSSSGLPSGWTVSSCSSTPLAESLTSSRRSSRPSRTTEDKIQRGAEQTDQIETQQLMRVYGALMWSWGRSSTPRGGRVYIGSFWSHRSSSPTTASSSRPRSRTSSKTSSLCPGRPQELNDLIKRARLAKVDPEGGWQGRPQARALWGGRSSPWDWMPQTQPLHSLAAPCHVSSESVLLCTHGCPISSSLRFF